MTKIPFRGRKSWYFQLFWHWRWRRRNTHFRLRFHQHPGLAKRGCLATLNLVFGVIESPLWPKEEGRWRGGLLTPNLVFVGVWTTGMAKWVVESFSLAIENGLVISKSDTLCLYNEREKEWEAFGSRLVVVVWRYWWSYGKGRDKWLEEREIFNC